MARGRKRGAEELDVGSFLEEARKKARKDVLASLTVDAESIDLGHLIRSCQGLISTNLEIWERCKNSSLKCEQEVPKAKTTRIDKSFCLKCEQKCPNIKLIRFSFHEVSCKTSSTHFEVKVQAKREGKDFGPFPGLSSDLLNILPPKDSISFDPLNSCDDYFQKGVSSLCDDMLGPFLLHLKGYLEHVQVFLGDIESWLIAPQHHAAFLSKLFKKEITIKFPEDIDLKGEACRRPCTRVHSPSSICGRCNKPFRAHLNGASSRIFCHLCPGKESFGLFFSEYKPVVLLQHPYTKGSHSSAYNLDSDDDQRKLQKLMEYILC